MNAMRKTKTSMGMRTAMTAIAAAVFTLGATMASAQQAACPMGGAGPGMHGAAGMHGGPGMRGGPGFGGDGGMMFPRMFEQAKAQLNLNTAQQQLWDAAVAEGKAGLQAGIANRQKVKDAMTAELAKAEPDLRAVAAVADAVQAQNQAERHKVRDLWLNLYSTFTVEQKTVVKQLMQDRISRMASRVPRGPAAK